MASARYLGVPYHDILDVPERVIEAAWDGWQAERSADFELSAMMRGL